MDETNIRPRADEDFFDTTRIAIEGMTCDKCVATIGRAFRGRDGIRDVRVDRGSATATVTFDRRKLDVPQLHDLLLEHGYHPRRTAMTMCRWLGQWPDLKVRQHVLPDPA